jgi:hypothetical protein
MHTIKISSGIQKLIVRDSQTHREDGDRINLLQERRLITMVKPKKPV